MRISDWSSDVCSSDLKAEVGQPQLLPRQEYCRTPSVVRGQWGCRLSPPAGRIQTPGTTTLESKTEQLSPPQPPTSWQGTTGSGTTPWRAGAWLPPQPVVNQ